MPRPAHPAEQGRSGAGGILSDGSEWGKSSPVRLKQTGCGIVQGIFQVGSMPHELATRNMTIFAREVMPALRAEFP